MAFLFSVVEVRRKSVDGVWSEPSSPVRSGLMSPPLARPSPFHISDCSNSSWAEIEPFVIGNVQMYPPNTATKQYFILKYLTPMGEYQEVSGLKQHFLRVEALLCMNLIHVSKGTAHTK